MNMRLTAKTAIFLSLALAAISSPVLEGRAETLPFKSYTTSDGLAHDRIFKIVRDSRGFLWFCTGEGLSRFDGYEFKNYTQDDGLPNRSIYDFLETRAGEIWLATGDGLVLFDPMGWPGEPGTAKARMFRHFRPDRTEGETKAWVVRALAEDTNGVVWAATWSGVFRIEKQHDWVLTRFEIPAAVGRNEQFQRILLDAAGAIWIGTQTGLYRILPDGTSVQTVNDKMRVESLMSDKTGRVWVGSAGGAPDEIGLHLFSIEENEPRRIRRFEKRDGLVDDSWVNALLETADGRIYVGVGQGLSEYLAPSNTEDPSFRVLSKDPVTALGEDASGNVWVGTSTSGTRRLAKNGFVNYDRSDNLTSPAIGSIIAGADGETYVIAGNEVIHRFNGRNFDVVRPRGMLPLTWGTGQITFRDRMGAWWVVSGHGLQRYPEVARLEDLAATPHRKIYTRQDGLFTNEVFQAFEDARGDIWASNLGDPNDYLTRWDRATDTFQRYTAADGLPNGNAATAFAEDRAGNLWVGFYSGGLRRFRGGRFETISGGESVPTGFINNIFRDSSGRLWVSTSSRGMIRIDEPTAEEPRLAEFTTRDGLASNQATCTTEDNFGRIYVSTGRGVTRLDLATGRVKVFTKADGLPENYVTQCKRDASGALWFGTLQGLARYVPVADERGEPPPVFVADVRVNGASTKKMSELGTTAVSGLDLASDQRQIQIEFFALGFATGESLRYQYRLDGIDADWSEPSALRNVNLNLSAGNYHFLVRAVNSDGVTSTEPASVMFSIARPVWQRWWFLLLLTGAICLIISAAYRYRLKRLVELERVRTRIATDLHDDIGSSLSQIAILSEVVRQKIGDSVVNQPLNMIADTSREMVDSMSDIVWAINPNKDHLSDLLQRMRRFASDILDASDIDHRFHADETHREIALGADVRREVYLMFKECINNIVKHAAASDVEMSMKVESKFLVVKVADNGRGFEPPQNSASENGHDGFGGNGLINMRRRAENLGGTLSIGSILGKGTTIEIKVPVKEKKTFRPAT